MILGALASTGESLAGMFAGAGSVLGDVAGLAAAHPVLAAVATIGGSELCGDSKNPSNLGKFIDTLA